MATRGYENFTATDVARHALKHAQQPKPSKYRNVKTVVDGETFDSKREAAHWQLLKLREKVGEISNLSRQVSISLLTPTLVPGQCAIVAVYIADFTYYDKGDRRGHTVDAKGKRTQMYALKKKWLELQSGIVIEEV